METSRRSFLGGVCGVAAFALAAPAYKAFQSLEATGMEAFLRSMRGNSAVSAIADAYFALREAPQTENDIRQALIRDLEYSREGIGGLIAQDFGTGRFLVQDGWPISETEARLCALAHLSNV